MLQQEMNRFTTNHLMQNFLIVIMFFFFIFEEGGFEVARYILKKFMHSFSFILSTSAIPKSTSPSGWLKNKKTLKKKPVKNILLHINLTCITAIVFHIPIAQNLAPVVLWYHLFQFLVKEWHHQDIQLVVYIHSHL